MQFSTLVGANMQYFRPHVSTVTFNISRVVLSMSSCSFLTCMHQLVLCGTVLEILCRSLVFLFCAFHPLYPVNSSCLESLPRIPAISPQLRRLMHLTRASPWAAAWELWEQQVGSSWRAHHVCFLFFRDLCPMLPDIQCLKTVLHHIFCIIF